MFNSIDLFAGIGGIRLGFDRAFGNDIKTVFVSEWDAYAQKTYKTNFNDDFDIAGDITAIDEKDIPDFDICLAGFPCQAFSLAGQRKGFKDNYKGLCRGTLFQEVARICEYHKPKVIFCENVKGLVIHDKGRTFKIICKTFEDLGYKVFHQVLNSKNFGVPQNRERIYIVAFRNDIAPDTFSFPTKTDDTKTLIDIREENPVPAKYYLSDTYLETLRKHKARHEARGNGFGYEIREWDSVAGAIVCGGMGRERNLVIDKRQKNLVPTTHIKGEINKEGIRKMTPREWARLQGFPDTYELPLADIHLYRQLGNSVTVNVIEEIAKKIKEVLFMSKLSGNKGEWSEVYVFLRTLALGKLYAADEELNKIDNVFYNILNIIRNEKSGVLEFRVLDDVISVWNTDSKKVMVEISRKDFNAAANKLYHNILGSSSPSFTDKDTEDFLSNVGVNTLKAKSTDKSDIRIKIHDINSGYEAVQGFSIKSRLGSPSTLINAGKTTNFVFEVNGINDTAMNEYNALKPFKDRFKVIEDNGGYLQYQKTENPNFENNLLLLDGDLPKICAVLLLNYYRSGISSVKQGLDILTNDNPLKYDLTKGHPFYFYKFKKLLTECALGMLPSKTWDGKADATGGYIIVREDGEVLCYHLFNRNEFENYLVNNTRFETASTSRHDFGYIYKEDEKYYLKLNLQVRFKK